MQDWILLIVARPGTEAANQPWPQHAPRRKVTIERLGSYSRVILLAGEAEPVRPWIWA